MMIKNITVKKALVAVPLVITVFVLIFTFGFFKTAAADDAFEKSISAFPESYKPYLRALHEDYPTWSFQPFITGLDWNTVIDNEHDDYALVYRPDAARIFMSLDPDDYVASEDRFIYKDGSFVAASRTAVEYFMDPRNFLDKGGIFQFELLSFSELYTVAMVEEVLAGSFMGGKKMTYVDASGKSYTDKLTYAQAMYNAGKTYNINPCFLASKILNEVGSDGSDSVSGTNDTYPGIYNFYNIGATDGAGAIERGLLWAKGGTSGSTYYSRPWTTPYKSIMGGAQFLAEEYIAAGQFTGYLQRFNVNPDSDYNLYSHQYMSNLTGALSQGYSTYRSYRDMDMLGMNLVFSIPVYKKMSDESGKGVLVGAESTEQYGTINTSIRYVRKGPSVDHDIVTSSSGAETYVEKGEEVKILGKVDTDAYYYEEILAYPYWYKISYTFSGKTYTGYIPGSNIDITTGVYVSTGLADISFIKSSGVKNKITFSDPSMVEVIDSDTVKFLKKGKVKLYIYDSIGHIEEILFVVGNYSPYYSSGVKATVSGSTLSVVSDTHTQAVSYGYGVGDTYGSFKKATFTDTNSATVSNLKSGTLYRIFTQNCYGKNVYSKAVETNILTKPDKVQNLDFVKDATGAATLSWTAVSRATGYQLFSYDEETDKYTQVMLIDFGKNSCKLTAAQAAKENFVIRAYSKYDSLVSYGSLSNLISLSEKPSMPVNVKISSVTQTGYVLSWTGDGECDGYEIFVRSGTSGDYSLYKTSTKTSLTFSGLPGADVRQYRVRAYNDTASGRVYSVATNAVTAITLPEKVSGLTVTVGSGKATLQWKAVSGADSYEVLYRKSGGELKTLKASKETYEISGLDSFSLYYFAVSASVTVGDSAAKGERSSTVSAVTKPKIPEKFAVAGKSHNYVELSWKADSLLDAYKVFILDSNGKLIGDRVFTDRRVSSVRIDGLESLTTYKFIIRGYKHDGKNYIPSDNSETLTVATLLPVVENVKSSSVTETSFRLSWDKISGAEYYTLYQQVNGKFEKRMTVAENYCDVTMENAPDVGRFYLTASFRYGNNILEGDAGEEFTASTLPSKITGIVANAASNSVTLTWDKVNDAYCYRVYLKVNGSYVLKKTVAENTCTLTGLKDCATNYVAVRAYYKNTTGVLVGAYTESKFYTLPLSVNKIVQSNRTDMSYTLTWKKSSAAVNRYYVYRYNTETKKYDCLGSTEKTSCNIKNMIPGTTQRYAVIASVVKDGKVIVSSKHTYSLNCSTYLSKTENLRTDVATTNALRIAWDKVEGATGYRVYYYNTSSKEFKLLGTTKNTQATFKNLPSGKEYIFRVNAIKQTENGLYLGYYSSVLYASTK